MSSKAVEVAQSYEASELKGEITGGRGVYVMTASTELQVAQGDRTAGMGVFTTHLYDGLMSSAIVSNRGPEKKLGMITVCSLYGYVSKMARTPVQTPKLFWRNVDIPGRTERRDDNLPDMVIANIYDLAGDHTPSGFRLWDEGPLLPNLWPTYILNDKFQFLDWNANFEILVARPLRLRRGEHVRTFLENLENWESEVKPHSMRQFPPGERNSPQFDIERLEFKRKDDKRFGLIVFDKLASGIRDGSGNWCVTLSVAFAQRPAALQESLLMAMGRDQMWSTYADYYDLIIGEFSHYQSLVEQVVNQVDGSERCLDIGAGTGGTTLRLLETMETRTVHAVEPNYRMLRLLDGKIKEHDRRAKAENSDVEERSLFSNRVQLSHCDCATALSDRAKPPYFVANESYDACVMMNVLFPMEEPVESLREIWRVLKPHGKLVLSTSHGATDIHKLFAAIEREIKIDPARWASKKEAFQSAIRKTKRWNQSWSGIPWTTSSTFLTNRDLRLSTSLFHST